MNERPRTLSPSKPWPAEPVGGSHDVTAEEACMLAQLMFPNADSWATPKPKPRPLPRRISYTMLLREIFQQVEDKAEAQKLVDRIRCVGVPGQWSVGIYIHGEGVVNPIPYRTFKTYGEGF